jgi:ubiquinone/menaquinone biosynthesis C-methylase UbiE
MDAEERGAQSEGARRLLGELVELRGRQIQSMADSARSYDELHAEGHLRQRDSFYIWLLSLLSPKRGQMLLDLSCGQGRLLRFAAAAGLRTVGFDLSPQAAWTAIQAVPQALVSVADAQQLPYADSTFHFVTNIGSLEHYFQPHLAVQEMARILRPDGLALVLLPNTFGLLGNILHVWRTGDVFDDGQPLQRYGTVAQWRELLERYGLRVTATIKYERAWPRTWEDLVWYILRPHKLARAFLTPLIPLNLASFLVYRCEKALS